MSGNGARRIEAGVDIAAALILAAATAYGAAAFIRDPLAPAAGVIMFAGCLSVLRRTSGRQERGFALAPFAPRALELEACPELLLGPADILARIDPDARVVRLFDPAAMPAPGPDGPNARHPIDGTSPTAPPDASQALYDALAELRRSLR